jgi:hypothetical protein
MLNRVCVPQSAFGNQGGTVIEIRGPIRGAIVDYDTTFDGITTIDSARIFVLTETVIRFVEAGVCILVAAVGSALQTIIAVGRRSRNAFSVLAELLPVAVQIIVARRGAFIEAVAASE